MNGGLPLSTTTRKPRRPLYDNRRVSDFRAWYRDNEPRLSQHYDALTACYARIGDWDFFEFVACEHEREEAGAARQATLATPPTFWQFLRELCFGSRCSRDPNKYQRRDWPAEDLQ